MKVKIWFFKDYLLEHYFTEENLKHEDPFFLNIWKGFHKEPDYIIHMENMAEDLRELPFFTDEEKVEEVIKEFYRYK